MIRKNCEIIFKKRIKIILGVKILVVYVIKKIMKKDSYLNVKYCK